MNKSNAVIMKKTFDFGKIAYSNKRRRSNRVTVEAELRRCTRKSFEYLELSIRGCIWNVPHTNTFHSGQCLDEIAKYKSQLADPDTFEVLYDLWKKWHLNGMHAGTPEQEAAIKLWEAAGNKYDYAAACDMLKEKNLYEVNFTGFSNSKHYNNEPYRYGSDWLVQELPGAVLIQIEHLLSTRRKSYEQDCRQRTVL